MMNNLNAPVSFSNLHRKTYLKTAAETHWDVLIIGGGVTGAGTALDMAERGLKVLLVDKHDFSFGTSSRSTKLIHGGLRYLKQLELKLVREVGQERAILHRNAPHLVIPEKMLLPVIKNGQLGKWTTSAALSVYDFLADVQKTDRKKSLSKTQTLKQEPLLKKDIVKSGFLYSEYRTDDARLVIELMKSATSYGALPINYLSAKGFIYVEDKLKGAVLADALSGEEIEVKADYVINAAGPWVDTLRQLDGSLENKKLHLTRGVHIVVPHKKFPLKQSAYFDTEDGRMIFAIPRERVTYIGTTDTTYTENIEHPTITKVDVKYLINTVSRLFPEVNLSEKDIESTWSGLRPLIHEEGKSPSELSRKDEVFIANSGLISIAGGKLTGYRKMAERLTDYVMKQKGVNRSEKKCKTDSIRLTGANGIESEENLNSLNSYWTNLMGEGEDAARKIYFHRYGMHLFFILQKTEKSIRSGLQPFYALLMAEVEYAVHFEMITHPNDFFIRRTGSLYFDRPYMKDRIEPVLNWMADWFNTTEEQKNKWREDVLREWDAVLEFL